MQKYLDYVQSKTGKALEGVSISVYKAGTSTLATLYSDNGSTTMANPLTSQMDGSYWFYAANGLYDLTYTLSGYSFDASDTEDVRLYDPSDHYYDLRSYADLAAAITAIGSTTATLVISEDTAVTANATVPSTCTLWFMGQGKFTVSVAVTCTINGPIVAEPRQIFAGSGTVAGLNFAMPEWWGSNTTPGTTDMTTPIQSAIAAVGSTAMVEFQATTYLVTDAITITGDRVILHGAGQQATIISFAPTTTGKTCFHFAKAANAVQVQCSIRGFGFDAAGNTQGTKTALKFSVNEELWIEDIAVSNWSSAGKDCIGIHSRGWQTVRWNYLTINADIPIRFSDNPAQSLDVDHNCLSDCYLIADSNPCVTIDSGVNVSTLIFEGYQAWVGGTHGLYWNDTATAGVASNVVIKNLRTEQGTSATAYSIYINHNYTLQQLYLENCKLDNARRGVYLRKVQNALFLVTDYGGLLEALNATALTTSSLNFLNCFWQVGSTVTLTDYVMQLGTGSYEANKPIPNTAFYTYGNGDPTDGLIIEHPVYATASLPAASTAMNGRIVIEDAGAGNRNLIVYAGGERFRIDGGANV